NWHFNVYWHGKRPLISLFLLEVVIKVLIG
ncbi:MAG: hypothetical protein ACI9VT_004068, partial [Psychroserpens sp.]